MKSIVAFVLGATIVGVSSGVIADSRIYNVDTYNHENGYWCEQYASVHTYCDPEILTFNEENGYWN